MSNAAVIDILRVSRIGLDGREIEATPIYALRVYDNEDHFYDDDGYDLDSFKDKTPRDIIQLVHNVNAVGRDIVEFAKENSEGITVCDKFYTWEELKG